MARRAKQDTERLEVGWAIRLLGWLGALILIVPTVIVVLAGFNSGQYLQFPMKGVTLKWVGEFLSGSGFGGAYVFSMELAGVTTLVSGVVGTVTALGLSRLRFRGRTVVRSAFLVPILLPGIVIGAALYVFYIASRIGLAETFVGLLIGHVVVTLPYVVATVTASADGLGRSLEEAARSLGAGPVRAVWKVTIPLLVPGIIAGCIFAFIVSFGLFNVSLFLGTANLAPLPVVMYDALKFGFPPTVAAAGVFAIALVVVSMVITSSIVDLGKFVGVKTGS